MKLEGIVYGKYCSHGEWDDMTFNFYDDYIEYMGHTIPNVVRSEMKKLIQDNIRKGKLVLSDNIKPIQCINTYKFK